LLTRPAVSAIANVALPAGGGFAPMSKNRQTFRHPAVAGAITVARGTIDD
jgi:hypothetical protein